MLKFDFWKSRGVVTRGGGGRVVMAPSTEPNKVQQFHFQTSGILVFTGVQKLYEPEMSCFYRVCYDFWTIYGRFSFFKFVGEIITSR